MSDLWSIYKINQEIRYLTDKVDDHIDAKTGEVDEEGADILERISELLKKNDRLIEDVMKEIKNREYIIESLSAEEKKIANRIRQHRETVARLKRCLLGILEDNNGVFEGELFKAYTRKSLAVMDVNLDVLPDEVEGKQLKRVKIEPAKNEILKLIKSGINILGVKCDERKNVIIKMK